MHQQRSNGWRAVLATIAVALVHFAITTPAQADLFSFATPTGATTSGGPVSATAGFNTMANSISITLTNLQANPTDIAQTLSDLVFTVGGGASLTGSSQTGATSQEITVNSGGTFTVGPTLTTAAAVGWPYSSTATVGTLNVLTGPGHAGPAHEIIGPPGSGGTYSNANGSIAGNGPHNPFLNQTASFTITGPGITAATTITAVTFSFGTGNETVTGIPVPEPATFSVAACGAIAFIAYGWSRHRRERRRQAAEVSSQPPF
jgi:hypothetical protein